MWTFFLVLAILFWGLMSILTIWWIIAAERGWNRIGWVAAAIFLPLFGPVLWMIYGEKGNFPPFPFQSRKLISQASVPPTEE
ncbi:MAG: hypothetical protein NWR72_10475 [Bacteroidia bacterium]|nr:hypothetical protein [Bacteroidia bacterium]